MYTSTHFFVFCVVNTFYQFRAAVRTTSLASDVHEKCQARSAMHKNKDLLRLATNANWKKHICIEMYSFSWVYLRALYTLRFDL